jgi:N-acetyl-gamma-glutamyl-phosphate/LysW-gamma-L-alpha-aminoadipyl-6-phosphate reductase
VSDAIDVGVFGGAGYVGGELLRLLLHHPHVGRIAPVSQSLAGRRVDGPHPNLRRVSDLTFMTPDQVPACDVVFLATPHLTAMRLLPDLSASVCVIDLSADFRLRDPEEFERYYGVPHAAPDRIAGFVPGWPERYRARLAEATAISVPGCMATAAILALYPLAAAGTVAGRVWVDGRIGSSGSGASATMNPHAERSGALRVFAPAGHRHEAEIAQATGLDVMMSATGFPAVRGAQVLCRTSLAAELSETDLRRLYREHYRGEPFVRIVAQRRGTHRLPDPKILAGSNFCDVGFAVDPSGREAVLVAALDNLVKGAAGNAVQCLNVRMGWPERLGLEFPGLHPL